MNNATLAHRWANKTKDEGRASSFFFEHETIYSYGHHFPIARHYNGVVLFTKRGYSNSTAKHINHTLRACSHLQRVACYNVPGAGYIDEARVKNDTATHEQNIAQWISNIQACVQSLRTARKPELHAATISRLIDECKAYCTLFGIKLTKEQKKQLTLHKIEEYKALLKKADEAKEAFNLKVIKEGGALHTQGLQRWQMYDDQRFIDELTAPQKKMLSLFRNHDRGTYLRSNGKEVETSKGIKLPVNVAHRYYNWYLNTANTGGCNGDCNQKILEYDVTSVTRERLVVGCHDISRKEIDRLATQLQWK